jgi:hypothetical protein
MKHMKAILLALTALSAVAAFSVQGADFSPSEVCKAAISVEMGRKAKSMKTLQQSPPEISYRRDDGDSFKYRCKLDGGIVVWRAFFADTGEWGRWRDQYAEGDALTAWTVSDGELTINNDLLGVHTFHKKDF